MVVVQKDVPDMPLWVAVRAGLPEGLVWPGCVPSAFYQAQALPLVFFLMQKSQNYIYSGALHKDLGSHQVAKKTVMETFLKYILLSI